MPPGALVDRVQADQVVLDDLGQRPLDAGGRHVDQHVDAFEQLVDQGGIAQVAVTDLFARRDGRRARRPPAERRPPPSFSTAGRSTRPMFPLAPDSATLVMDVSSADDGMVPSVRPTRRCVGQHSANRRPPQHPRPDTQVAEPVWGPCGDCARKAAATEALPLTQDATPNAGQRTPHD